MPVSPRRRSWDRSKSSLFISLDGVIEAPETWHFDYFNDEMGAVVGALMGETDAMLLGPADLRRVRRLLAERRPGRPVHRADERRPQVRRVEHAHRATWENSTVITGDVAAELTALKQDTRLSTTGSAALVQLAARGGSGRRAAPAGAPGRGRQRQEAVRRRCEGAAQLVSSTTFTTGVLHLVYAVRPPS